jgi:hypothetical protein
MEEDKYGIEMEGDSEAHEYAMDLIRNLMEISAEELASWSKS